MTRVLTVLVMILTSGLCACSDVTETQLVGNYEANYAFGTQLLHLGQDDSYTQKLTGPTLQGGVEHAGRWEYSQTRGLVILHDPLMFDDNFGKLNPHYEIPVNGSWNLNVRKSLHGLNLSWNDDVGVVLRKVD